MERGIGSAQWVNNYVGLPYQIGGRSTDGIDCYGLVCKVYAEILGVQLPDWVIDDEVDFDGERGRWSCVDQPFDFCILRSARVGGMPDHFALFVAGGVLSAGPGLSTFTTLDNYLSKSGKTTYGIYHLEGDLH